MKMYCKCFESIGTMIISLLYIILISLVTPSFTQFISPCPRLFKYEPRGAENDRWYGTVTLLSDIELNGVWLRLIFDKPALQVGNWFGEAVSQDNKEYLIKNPKHKMLPHIPYNLRFYLKFNPEEAPPQLTGFRLNARAVCPEGASITEAPVTTGELITSNPLPVGVNGGTPAPPAGGSVEESSKPSPDTTGGEDDEDFLPGNEFAAALQSFLNKYKPTRRPSAPTEDFACGSVVAIPRPLITYGKDTREGEFPWHAALYHTKGPNLSYICGASLITKNHVITVAHCVTKPKSKSALNSSDLVIILGKYYLKKQWSSPAIQEKDVDTIVVHPEFSAQSYSNDIAIVRMSSPAKITDYVRPVCLWEGDMQLQDLVNKKGTVVGWGFDQSGRIKDELSKADMPVISKDTCIYSFPEFYSRFTTDETYCAGFLNGTSVCNGDSGGGMVFQKPNSNPNNPRWQLRGLVSLSVALQNQLKCDTSHYAVFTDVAKHLKWIKASLN